jgi:2-hydroxychromene-2-carboxylate isomerase
MAKTIQVWFDYASTYSYPAVLRVAQLATAHHISLHWRPFMLGVIFKQQGLNDSPYNLYPPKGRYMWRDMERLCAAQNIPFHKPTQFPRNGLLAGRIACLNQTAPWITAFIQAVYRANFVHDQDIADTTVVGDILHQLNVDSEGVIARAASEESKQKFRDQTGQAMELGIFGSPTFMIGDEMFWGGDRLVEAIDFAINP